MRIALLCATLRGLAVLKRLVELRPDCQLVIFSFREEPGEPRFFEAIRDFTVAHGGQFIEAKKVNAEHTHLLSIGGGVDLTLAVSWRYKLPMEFCKASRLGTFIFHDSLLPAYRGFAPTVWSIINGENHTGVTLFEVSEGIDEGDIVAQQRIEIGSEDTIATILPRVTESYLRLLEQNLELLITNRAPRRPQNHDRASYTCRRCPSDNEIRWEASTASIYNLIRAVTTPYPGAFTWMSGKKLTVWGARLQIPQKTYVGRVPGRVVEVIPGKGVVVLTRDGSLLLTEVQIEGGKAMCAADALAKLTITLGKDVHQKPVIFAEQPKSRLDSSTETSAPSSIPFNKSSLVGKELEHIFRTMTIGQIAGDQTYSRKCQQLLQQALGLPKALVTTSCSHALEMSGILLNIKPGDEVIVPSFTFVSTANAFALRGARIVFADIRPDTLNLDETRLEELITERTKAIVPVHYAGVGCEMDAILEMAGRHGVAIVEDNAHGLFGKYKGKWLGTFGSLATQSFHETKNITCGEGGALLINDASLIERAEIVREKGTDRSKFFRGQVDKYSWVDIGSSYVMSDVLAAFLYGQLEVWEVIQVQRRAIWDYYDTHLRGWAQLNGIGCPVVPFHCEQSYHMYYLFMPSLAERQALIAHLKARGILSVFHYAPLHLSPMGRSMGGGKADCPVTEEAGDRLLRLPFFNSMTRTEQDTIIEALLDFHRCGNETRAFSATPRGNVRDATGTKRRISRVNA